MINITTVTEGTTYIAKFEGRLDVNAAAKADDALSEIAGKADKLVLDFENVEYLSSAGLRVIKRVRLKMKDKNGSQITIRNLKPEIKDILEMTGVAAMLVFE